ncbi:NCS2 family permease [Aestuariibacter salexigens]|uniref:NCS2 family permease n=1 Tax=Aestuariibacter salexigens TaxID=226010 RepID=UPI0003FC779D|nr:NCS2 family permease [Aestuariibacter salexigens]
MNTLLRNLDRYFHISEHGSTIRTEVLAGLTTFAAMSYILVVNPNILAAGGMPIEGLITVTALAAAIGTLLMAILANYPIALAPGMGLNAFFAFTMCLTLNVPWQGALGIVFWNGVLFIALSLSGIRSKIADAIPDALKIGVQCGIGLFIAFIGLKNAGIISANPATLVSLGDLSQAAPLVALAGIILTVILMVKKIPGAILLSVLFISIAGLFIQTESGPITHLPEHFVGMPDSIQNTWLKMDIGYPLRHFEQTWDLVFALLFVNMFDTIGTLIGVSRKAGLLDAQNKLPKMGKALTADATASIAGAALGTSPVTSYVESAAGISAGGRTGLTGVVVAILFILALFLTPVMKAIPLMATTPALVMIGILMMESFKHIDTDDLTSLATATVALLTMPLTFSISEGIALGAITYTGIMLGTGRGKQVSWLTYGITTVFVMRYIFGVA